MHNKPSVSIKNTIAFSHPASLIATFFCVGKIPFAPGTMGSIATFPFAALLLYLMHITGQGFDLHGSDVMLISFPYNLIFWSSLIIIALFFLGVWTSNIYMEKTHTKDPGAIVIDEVVGQLFTLFLTAPLLGIGYSNDFFIFLYLLLAFLLFRLFDIIKLWPANWADKKVAGGLGVMLDDIFAAIHAAIALYLLLFVYLIWSKIN